LSRKKIGGKLNLEQNEAFNLYFDEILDFHGYFPDKAILELEEVLFAKSENSSILVVHGNGSGVLKQRIRHFVCSSDLVASYEFGEISNLPGGAGVVLIYT